VSNYTPIFNHQPFDPEQVKTMSDVYDLVVRTFPADSHEAVALAVLAAGSTGEKDRDELYDLALKDLSTQENSFCCGQRNAMRHNLPPRIMLPRFPQLVFLALGSTRRPTW